MAGDRSLPVAESAQGAWAVLDALPDPLLLLRPIRDGSGNVTDMLILAANEALSAVVPPTRQPFVGRTLLEAFPERADVQDKEGEAPASGKPIPITAQKVRIPGIGATRRLA